MPRHEIHISQSFIRGAIGVDILRHEIQAASSRRSLAMPVEWREIASDDYMHSGDSCFYLRPDEAQQLMDELWRVGVRPSEGSGSAGALRQAELHIDSLRAIAFKLAGVEGK